jgi:hypothetical protein
MKMGMTDKGEWISHVPAKFRLVFQYRLCGSSFMVTARIVDAIELEHELDTAEAMVSEGRKSRVPWRGDDRRIDTNTHMIRVKKLAQNAMLRQKRKVVNEEENLDEISQGLAGRYRSFAKTELDRRTSKALTDYQADKPVDKENRRISMKRFKGIKRADKYFKKEQIEENFLKNIIGKVVDIHALRGKGKLPAIHDDLYHNKRDYKKSEKAYGLMKKAASIAKKREKGDTEPYKTWNKQSATAQKAGKTRSKNVRDYKARLGPTPPYTGTEFHLQNAIYDLLKTKLKEETVTEQRSANKLKKKDWENKVGRQGAPKEPFDWNRFKSPHFRKWAKDEAARRASVKEGVLSDLNKKYNPFQKAADAIGGQQQQQQNEAKTYGRVSHPGGGWKFKGTNTPSENQNPQNHSPAMQHAVGRINAAFPKGSIKRGGNNNMAKMKSEMGIKEGAINELHSDTLKSYIGKAKAQRKSIGVDHNNEDLPRHQTRERRFKGIDKAERRLNKKGDFKFYRANEETLNEIGDTQKGREAIGKVNNRYLKKNKAAPKHVRNAVKKAWLRSEVGKLKEDNLSEVSRRKAFAAYAGTQDPDRDDDEGLYKTGERLKGHIKKKWGKEGVSHAERHSFATHFGRGKKNVKESQDQSR